MFARFSSRGPPKSSASGNTSTACHDDHGPPRPWFRRPLQSAGDGIATCTLLACGALFATSVFISLRLAEAQGAGLAQARASELAEAVVQVVDAITGQVAAALASVATATSGEAPCSARNVAMLQDVQARYSYVSGLARLSPGGDRVLCSTLGPAGEGLQLGPADHAGPTGLTMRRHVAPPGMQGAHFNVLVRGDIAVFVHGEVARSILFTLPQAALGAYSSRGGPVILSRGTFERQWFDDLLARGRTASFDGERLIAVSPSAISDYIGFIAFPAERVRTQVREARKVLVPLGAGSGLVLATALFLLMRHLRSMPAALKRALSTNRVFMQYQPIVDLRTRRCIGVEALARWRHRGEFVPPDRFIVAAEQAGIMQQVTRRVVDLVAWDMADFLRINPGFHVSINLSASDLRADSAAELLAGLLRVTGLPASSFWVEATETGFVEGGVGSEVIDQIRSMGIRVAVDDFGTGYSSLALLDALAVDLLKIDKRFVASIARSGSAPEVVTAIIGLARALGLEMVAEGVETEQQAQFLAAHGVQYAQGWLFGRPGPLAALQALRPGSPQSPRSRPWPGPRSAP
jgi:sensor c-di-GMP phosphodiesterase-like protein